MAADSTGRRDLTEATCAMGRAAAKRFTREYSAFFQPSSLILRAVDSADRWNEPRRVSRYASLPLGDVTPPSPPPPRSRLASSILFRHLFLSFSLLPPFQITKLKIDSNPFAKGFRDSSRLTDFER